MWVKLFVPGRGLGVARNGRPGRSGFYRLPPIVLFLSLHLRRTSMHHAKLREDAATCDGQRYHVVLCRASGIKSHTNGLRFARSLKRTQTQFRAEINLFRTFLAH